MKSSILLLLPVLTLAALAGDAPRDASNGPIGRFRLFEGETIFVHPDGHTSLMKTLWKVDTSTGRAWHFFTGGSRDGSTSERWVETFDQLTTYNNSKPNENQR